MAERGMVAITGGASGIGLTVAQAAAASGWEVAIADRDGPALDRAAALLPATRRSVLDVTDEAAVEAWIAELSGLVALVASAGIGAEAHALETDAALFRRILEVNVLGSFLAARAAARAMRAAGRGGAIVLLGSVSGMRGGKGRSAYGASKAAVINMAQAMAVDLAGDGIRVNVVCPGPVETPLVAAVHTAETRAQWLRQVPLGRYAAPEEVAQAVLFLIDPARAGYVTGHALAVDGGFAGAGLMPG